MCIDDDLSGRNRGGSGGGGSVTSIPSGDARRNSINRVSIRFVTDDRSLFASYKNCD